MNVDITTSLTGTATLTFSTSHLAFDVVDIVPIAKDAFKVVFSGDVIADAAYFALTNYIVRAKGTADNLVRRLGITKPEIAIDHVLLHTSPVAPGTELEFFVSPLRTTVGTTNHSVVYKTCVYEQTKVDAILKSLPPMYYKGADSKMRALLTAVALEDNVIGGPTRVIT